MKKLVALFVVSFFVIAAVMVYLVTDGISLRSAPVIRPSPTKNDPQHVAHAVVQRLFPDFQSAHYVVWGLPDSEDLTWPLVTLMQQEYEKHFQRPVTLRPSTEDLSTCPRPCWILAKQDQANELDENSFPKSQVAPLGKTYFNLTIIPFQGTGEAHPDCVQEKRLSFRCLVPLSIHEAQRKMKKKELSYFFLRKYQDRDYFLFVETAGPQP